MGEMFAQMKAKAAETAEKRRLAAEKAEREKLAAEQATVNAPAVGIPKKLEREETTLPSASIASNIDLSPEAPKASNKGEELAALRLQRLQYDERIKQIEAQLNPEEKRLADERILEEQANRYFNKIMGVDPEGKKYTFKILENFNDKIDNATIGIAADETSLGIKIGSTSYKMPISTFKDARVIFGYLGTEYLASKINSPKEQRSILEVAFKNNLLNIEKLEEISRPEAVVAQSVEIVHVQKTVEISEMSSATLSKLWQDSTTKTEGQKSETKSAFMVDSSRITGMKDFIDGPATRLTQTFQSLNDSKEQIKSLVRGLNDGSVTSEIFAAQIREEKRKLEEIKSLQASICAPENLSPLITAAKGASFPHYRSGNLLACTEVNNPEKVINTFAADSDGVIANTFKNIKTISKSIEGIDTLLKICQACKEAPEKAQAIAAEITRAEAAKAAELDTRSRSRGSSRAASPTLSPKKENMIISNLTKTIQALEKRVIPQIPIDSGAPIKVDQPKATPKPKTTSKSISTMEL